MASGTEGGSSAFPSPPHLAPTQANHVVFLIILRVHVFAPAEAAHPPLDPNNGEVQLLVSGLGSTDSSTHLRQQ